MSVPWNAHALLPEGVNCMDNYIIMCRSITYAQRAQRLLERVGIAAYISKAPQGLTPEGCSYGVRVSRKNAYRSMELLRRAGIRTGRVYRLESGGEAREIEL